MTKPAPAPSHHPSRRWSYYRRIFSAYLTPATSHLTFWHEPPEANDNASAAELGEYYMPFLQKADYVGPCDGAGIPLLDYRGTLGLQYNPIAIAQYGLGNYNAWRRSGDAQHRGKFLAAADWLLAHLEQNSRGLWVWNHHFDWEYRTTLKAPWYSGLAQGQGVSLLVRAHAATGNTAYADAAQRALQPLLHEVSDGGVCVRDEHGRLWLEEYIVDPPTHILNGFLWTTWGVYDYWLATRDAAARALFDSAVETLAAALPSYDTGYWSLYEHSGTRMKMLASPFYHRLHIVQLRVMHRLTGKAEFQQYAERWEGYRTRWSHRQRALLYKTVFKLLYY